jgi:NADPH:quinone reductase-like Zn-dependent oxidoreductase
MRAYRFNAFGLENLKLENVAAPVPGPGEVRLDVQALSLNYRDLMVVKGLYNPRLRLPAAPLSDGAGAISAVGPGVTHVTVGQQVCSHFISGWLDGRFRAEYAGTTLGTPGPGLAAEQVILPAGAVVPIPLGYDFAEAATLPIAALTAWSALRTVANVTAGQRVLTLGTGGVSIFALQLAKLMRAQVIITSSSDEKLELARRLNADYLINYKSRPDWETLVLEFTQGEGADLTVETGGAGTLAKSMRATRAEGIIAMLGALTGLKSELDLRPVLSRRLRIAGVFVDSRAAFEAMNRFIEEHGLKPAISRRFPFEELPAGLRAMEAGEHFGKIVVEL